MAVGRPREFDPDVVLETVMGLFWEHGFEGVSISDLTDATGINRRSLYAEFGSKDQLFRRAVQRYMAGPADTSPRRSSSRPLGRCPTRWCTVPPRPTPATAGPADACSYRARWRRARTPRRSARTLCSSEWMPLRCSLAGSTKRRPAANCPASYTLGLSRWVNAICQGISIQARSGATRDELHELADTALKGWPAEVGRIG